MHKFLTLAAATLCAVAAHAQSCNGPAPAGTFPTLWAGGVYLGTTSATAGFNSIFDLTASADLTISQVDMNFYDNGVPATNPVLTGLSTTVEFYTVPSTWVGNQATPANWTLLGTGTVTIAAPGTASPAIFSPPFVLPAGAWGVAIRTLPVLNPATNTNVGAHPLYTNPTSTPGTATVYSDQYLTLTAGGFQGTAWVGSPPLRVINTRIHYQPGANAGYTLQYGNGCYNRPQSFYEYAAGPAGTQTTYDLSNTSVSMINQGNNYLVLPSTSPWIPPTSPALAVVTGNADDGLAAAQTLPFSFPYPGGTTTQIIPSTNGHIFLGTSTATFGPYTFSAFFTDVPRLAPFWTDLDLTTFGTMHFDVDPNNQFAVVSWVNAPEWDPATTPGPGLGGSTFQVVLYSTGQVEFIYQGVSHWHAPLGVGFGRGNGTGDPGSRDLSTSMPFSSGDGSTPARHSMSQRPVVGTSPDFVISNITPGTPFAFLVLSFGSAPGNDLGIFGLPGCAQHIALPAIGSLIGGVSPTNTATWTLALPNNTALNGVNLYSQGAPLTGGLNAAGIVTTNGLCTRIGLQ